jgi:hypothetical protein
MKFWLKLFSLFSAVAAASTAMAQTVSITAPVAGAKVAFNAATTITADAAPGSGTGVTVSQVQFFANGIAIGSPDTTAPFSVAWTPGAAGTYSLTAVVTDSASSTKTSTAVSVEAVDLGLPPTVVISSPASGSQLIVGFATTISATASDPDGNVASVQFIANGAVVGTVTTFPFNFSWTPASPGLYALTAKATDNSGNITTSAAVNVTVGAGSSPTVTLTSPLANTTVNAGLAVVLAANASDVDGTVASVKFVANNIVVGSATTSPYRVSWTPPASGTYVIFAQATDSNNNVTQSGSVTLTVSTNHSPTVSITTPSAGAGVQVGSATKITATAADQDGPLSQVQFFANGISIGSTSSSPYTVSWTPSNEGLYHLTAIATDGAGSSTTSTDVGVLAFATTAAKTTTVYTGFYLFGFEKGTFSLVTVGGSTATFIAQPDQGYGTQNYVYVDMPLDASGGFNQTVNGVTIKGTTGGAVSGTITGLSGSAPFLQFMGAAVAAGDNAFAGRGYYTGSLDGRAGSYFYAIVGGDGSTMLYAKDGSFSDVAGGKIPVTGDLSGLHLTGGGGISGKVDTATGFISGSFTGASTASFSGTLTSGGLFSDGSLRNISTRGQVGSGDNVLIMGFIVGGNTPKRVLLRAIGPGLATHGIASGFIADPKLDLRTGNTLLASNDNWDPTDAAIAAYGTLAAKDAALVVTLSPGAYTVTVSAATGSGGLALVECYDLDSVDAFSAQKVVNISTRGLVGTGQNVLIGGFIISGNASKRVLVRAVGPTLSSFNVSGVLADPELSLLRLQSDGTYATVRANGDWEAGNDVSQIAAATLAAGAYDLPAGSKDASMLVVLPPGTYTTVVSGSGATSGIALVEVWEVP